MFQYTLDKSSKKFFCPHCGKKTFVKYINTLENNYLDDQFGRCDRESNCKYHLTPKQNGGVSELWKPIIPKQNSTLQSNLLIQSGRNFKENNFVQFLKNHFTKEEIQTAILKYLLGTSKHWNGATVFWQIDSQQRIRTGKVMLFDNETGKRVKEPFNHIHWAHRLMKQDDFILQQCLFGLHLVDENSTENIAIVESEKTAVMMSIFLPQFIWIATGSKGNFKKEMLLPLKKHTILAYPDKSEFDDWNKKTLELQKDGFKIKCSRFIEDKNVPVGTDLVDIYLEIRKVSEINFTKTEIEVNRLSQINPQIINLIKTFELLDNCHNKIVNIG